jgi:class 3 adenylate cyclase
MTTNPQVSAESRLDQLLARLLAAAERSLAAGELELARATAEEVCAVDPDNRQATEILARVGRQQRVSADERALMTLVFSDLVGSTALSERVEPEQIRDIFARYRAEARAAVEHYGGYVIQYMGDGVLAGFGYPFAHEDDARRAVLAGLELVAGMKAARPELANKAGMDLSVRVGIHTGRVVVTDLGEDRIVKERDSIVGVAPNLAARVQAAALPDTVVISDVTRQLVELDFHLSSLGLLDFKGISRPVEVFAVESPRHAVARLESERYRPRGMVGREVPVAQLMDAWQELAAPPAGKQRSGRLFLVSGETGIGKSRLVAAISDRVSDLGGYVITGGCLPYYANLSLWPVAQMITRSIGLPKEDGDAALNRLVANLVDRGLDPREAVPFLAPLVGIDEPKGYPAPQLEPTAFLDETYNKILDWIEHGSRGGPLVLIMEDLHWADPSTLVLLGRVAQTPLPGVLTIATTRDVSAIPWSERAEVMVLDRLERSASESLVDSVAAGADLDDKVRATIIHRADGVPLFLEELTRSVLASPSGDLVPLRLQEILANNKI